MSDPTHTPPSAHTQGSTTGERLLDTEEVKEFTRQPYADLTVDSEPDHLRDSSIDYNHLAALTAPPSSETLTAEWHELRRLDSPPPLSSIGAGAKVFVCVQHPHMVIMDGEDIVGQFDDGYLVTDDSRLITLLTHPNQRYVKLLDLGRRNAGTGESNVN